MERAVQARDGLSASQGFQIQNNQETTMGSRRVNAVKKRKRLAHKVEKTPEEKAQAASRAENSQPSKGRGSSR